MTTPSVPETAVPETAPQRSTAHRSPRTEQLTDGELSRWGGVSALAGTALMIGAVAVVVALGLPDASDPETLTDFDDIEAGRIAEHLLYLGALVFFVLHVLVLRQLLGTAHPPAALFGGTLAATGLGIMAASSLLHVSTAPLADLYGASDPAADSEAIEYAWHGAQSVFDTMLATGVLLVPIGIVLLGVAMRRASAFSVRIAGLTIGLGVLGAVGAVISIVDTASDASAASVLAIVVFHLITGWRTLRLASEEPIRLTAGDPPPAG